MKKCILIIVCLLTFTGCKDYREIENLTIATAIAVDKAENNSIRVCIEVVKFKKDTSEVFLVEGYGKTYPEAINNTIKITGNELYFSHAQVMIKSEDIAREGIYPLIDHFYRNSNLRLDMAMLVAKDVEAKEILTVESQIDDIAGIQIKKIIDSNKLVSEVPSMPVYEFIDDVSSEGVSGTLPVIQLTKDYKGDDTREIGGYAIFKHDSLYQYLDKNQTKTLAVLKNKAESGKAINEYTITTPTYNIEKAKSSIKPKFENGKLSFEFKVDMELQVDELNSKKNILDPKVKKELEEEISLAIEKDINDLILFQKATSGSDFLGLGDLVYRKYPEFWNENKFSFSEYIENMEYIVEVKCKITSTGSMLKSIDTND